MRHAIADLKAQVNLAALIEQDLGPCARKSGRGLWYNCCFHRDKTASLWVTPDNGKWFCYGCGVGGDHLDWLQKRRKLSLKESMREMDRFANLPDAPRPPTAGAALAGSGGGQPSRSWQEAARAFAAYAEPLLWEGAGAPGLAYLRDGGLVDDTIRRFGLGWNPDWRRRDPARWGLDGPAVHLARGVVIPCSVAGVTWYVKIRCFDAWGQPQKEAGRKYSAPRKDPAASGGALFGADELKGDGRPLLLVEGERDAMLATQELGHLVDVASLGGAGKRALGRWLPWFLPYRCILVGYDRDEGGQAGAGRLLEVFGKRAVAVRVPHSQDLTGFHVAGGDLQAWISWELQQAGQPVK